MSKQLFLLICLSLLTESLTAQCLCGTFELQLRIPDLEFDQNKSNYRVLAEGAVDVWNSNRRLQRSDFSDDTLKLTFPTGGGIEKLDVEIENISSRSTLRLYILNMTYDNPYFLNLTMYTTGDYLIDWEEISHCQSENVESHVVQCKSKGFEQLLLRSEKPMVSGMNHNSIRISDLHPFIHAKDEPLRLESKLERLGIPGLDSVYHIENDRYLFSSSSVTGNGNHYYDEIRVCQLSYSGDDLTFYPLAVDLNDGMGRLDENGCLRIEQYQGYDYGAEMFMDFDQDAQILQYQFTAVDIMSNDNNAELRAIQFSYNDGRFELHSDLRSKVILE